MDDTTVLVLANATEPQLAMLDALPPATTIAAIDNEYHGETANTTSVNPYTSEESIMTRPRVSR